MPGRFDSRIPEFRRRLDGELIGRADRAGAVVRTRARLLASRPGTERLRSRRGEPPRRQTGRLVRSIVHAISIGRHEIAAVIGSDLDEVYPAVLERELDRPYLTRALRQTRDAIRRILIRGE